MYDLCMKWCNNPFKKDDLLKLVPSRINHILWFNENQFNKHYHRTNKIYLIAQWKQKYLHKKFLLPKRDRYFIFEHHVR
jgi:hypothetical protein